MRARHSGIFLWLILQVTHVMAGGTTNLPPVVAYAPSACQACVAWADHLRQHGFVVTQEEKLPTDMPRIKLWLNVPSQLESVQTARVAGYFVEGLVPLNDILRLLRERPRARGLAVKGPASDAPTGEQTRERPRTMLVGPDGRISVYTVLP